MRKRNNAAERRNRGRKRHAKMATELRLNLAGHFEKRRARNSSDGEFACCERGDTAHFREECVIYLARRRTINAPPHEAKNGGEKGTKGKRSEKREKDKGNEEIISLSFVFRKQKMIPLEMRRILRGKRRFLKKTGRIFPTAKF